MHRHRSRVPSPWITRHAGLIAAGARVLDLACGGGRHTRYLRDRGCKVTAIDIDTSGLADLADDPLVEIAELDLEKPGTAPLAGRRFDAVVVTDYLFRPLLAPLVDCLECRARVRADHIEDGACPSCGAVGRFTEERSFNLLFRTYVGPVEEDSSVAYLRPETAQGMFVNFENVLTSSRRRLPFGIAQIGRSYRNEITPGQFIFRTREFEQMEMEYFCDPSESLDWHRYWKEERLRWYREALGVSPELLRLRDHGADALSHYSEATADIEFRFPWGWGELEGVAHRGDYDLRAHAGASGRQLSYFDPERQEHLVPHVVEPAVGVDRILIALLFAAYDEETDDRGERRVVLRLTPDVAPVEVAVLPLSRNERLVPTARAVWERLRPHFRTQYDDAQSIGRRYRRQDEIGTPQCVTVDFDTLDDDAVTIRDRDTMQQVRVPVAGLVQALGERIEASRPPAGPAVETPARGS